MERKQILTCICLNHKVRFCKSDAYAATHFRVEILAEGDSGANDGSQIEDGPEDTNEDTLLLLRGVRKHQGALRGPKQTRTNALDGTCSQNERTCLRVDVGGATK